MKYFLQTILIISSMILLNACGGSDSVISSNSEQDTNTNQNNDNSISYAGSDYGYYVDSAVKGVRYECGDSIGTTDIDGKFMFEKGLGCTFYLGDVELRIVDSALLTENGVVIREADTQLGILLQSLDKNNNPDDGIEIPEDIQIRLSEAGITQLPSNDEELRAFIEAVGGVIVSEEEAANHMMNEKLRTLLIGKTHYFRNIDYITKVNFLDTGVWTFETENTDVNTTCEYIIKDGMVEVCSNNDSSQTWTLLESTEEYAKYQITYTLNRTSIERTLHLNRKLPDDELTERIEMYPLLADKTFYQYCSIQGGWSFVPIHFSADKSVSISGENKHYRLDPDYNLFIDDGTSTVKYPPPYTVSTNGVPNYTNMSGVPIYMVTEEDYFFYLDQGSGLINYMRGANFCSSDIYEEPEAL